MTAVASPVFEVTRLEYDVLWEHLRLGPFPTVYRVIGHGRTTDERNGLVRQAWSSLRARGLGAPASPHPALAELLGVLAQPQREVDARFGHRGAEVRALAAAAGPLAAVGILTADGFRFRGTTPGGLSRAVVSLLPTHRPGRGHSVSVSSTVLQAACATSGNTAAGLRVALGDHGLRSGDADQLAAALDGAFGGGQFGAAMRDRWGRRRRAAQVVGFTDTASGRYLLQRSTAAGGEHWTTLAPTDQVRLAAGVDRLLAELGRQLAG